MSELVGSFRKFMELATAFLKENMTVTEISHFADPTEYTRAEPVWNALRNFTKRLCSYATTANDNAFDSLPELVKASILGAIYEASEAIHTTLDSIKPSPSSSGHIPSRVSSFQPYADKLKKAEADLATAMIVLQIEASGRTQSPSEIEKLRSIISEAETATDKLQEQVKRAADEHQQVAAVVLTRDNIREITSSITAHEKAAGHWLKGFIVAGAIALGLAVWINYELPALSSPGLKVSASLPFPGWTLPLASSSPIEAIVHLVTRLILISLAIGICVMTSRIYQTHIHNAVVNRQRKMASVAFVEMLHAIESADPATKTELVKQAAQSVFAHTSTGFLNKANNELMPLASLAADLAKTAKG